MINGDYHVKYCVRNSLDKTKCIYSKLLTGNITKTCDRMHVDVILPCIQPGGHYAEWITFPVNWNADFVSHLLYNILLSVALQQKYSMP